MGDKVWPRVIVPFQGKLIYSIDDKNTQTVGLRFECNFCSLVFTKADSFIFHFTNSHGRECVNTLFREIHKNDIDEEEAEPVEEQQLEIFEKTEEFQPVQEEEVLEIAVGDNVEIINTVIEENEIALVEEEVHRGEDENTEVISQYGEDEMDIEFDEFESTNNGSIKEFSLDEEEELIVKEETYEDDFQSLGSELEIPIDDPNSKKRKRERTRVNTKMHTPILFEMIDQMAKHPNLWDDNDENYRKRIPRSNSYELITTVLKAKFPGANILRSSVRSKIGTLRKHFYDAEHNNAPIDPELFERLSFMRGRLKIEPRNIIRPNADGIYQCPHCNKQSKTRSNLSSHIRRLHLKDYTYKCHLCDKPFYSHFEMSVHIRTHTKEKPYYCEVCGKAFNTYSIMKMHQKQHSEERDFKCPICPKAYYRKDLYKEHIRSHDEVPKEICDICGKGFHTKRHLSKHKQRHKVSDEALYLQGSPQSSEHKFSI